MRKLLFIVGITATGKTPLGLYLAKKYGGELMSADSRQVYKGMDIGTGKDIPKNLKAQVSRLQMPDVSATGGQAKLKSQSESIPFYGNGTKIWGYDLVEPDEEFSVAHFTGVAKKIIQDMWKRGKLPIVVGGTGLYVKALTEPMPRMFIPPNRKLRGKLKTFSVQKLQILLKSSDPQRFAEMNNSDRKNPRRLVRAIEISKLSDVQPSEEQRTQDSLVKKTKMLWIGLKAPKQIIYEKIDRRVNKRVERGAEKEIRKLLNKGYSFDLPALSALGYVQWKPFIEGSATKNQVKKRWKLDEHAYARRQFTWFKRNKNIHWFDVEKSNHRGEVVRLFKQWYSGSKGKVRVHSTQ